MIFAAFGDMVGFGVVSKYGDSSHDVEELTTTRAILALLRDELDLKTVSNFP
jgi:hypothetical protein